MASNRQFSLEVLESFSGGLNLRSDQFNLQDNESPDLLNVTVDPRGGIRMRDGVDRRNVAPLAQSRGSAVVARQRCHPFPESWYESSKLLWLPGTGR